MREPARPAVPETALPAAFEALLMALPAELVTLERPCCAFEVASDALSFAWVARWDTASVAASVVEEAARLWTAHLDCRSASRGSWNGFMVWDEVVF